MRVKDATHVKRKLLILECQAKSYSSMYSSRKNLLL